MAIIKHKAYTPPNELRLTLYKLGGFMADEDSLNTDAPVDPAIQTFCVALDEFLDWLLMEDGFGTEGQLDPRGDHR